MRSGVIVAVTMICACGDSTATSTTDGGSTSAASTGGTGGTGSTGAEPTTGASTSTASGSDSDSVTGTTGGSTGAVTSSTGGTGSTGGTSEASTTDASSSGGTTGDPLACTDPVESPGGVIHFGGLGGEQALGFAVGLDGARYSGGLFFGPSVDLKPGGGAVIPAKGDGGNMWLNKVGADGSYQYGYTWPTLDGYHCYVWGFAPDPDGSVHVVGHFVGDLDLDPGPGTDKHVAGNGVGDLGAFLFKLGADGKYQWGRSWSAGEHMTAFGVARSADGALYVTGYFIGTADLDPGPGTVMATATGPGNASDSYLSKFDPAGDLLWSRTWGAGGELYGYQVGVDADGNAYVSGTIGGPGDLDPGPGTQIHTGLGLADTYVARFLNDGTWDWGFGVGGDGYDIFNAISVDPEGRVWLAGGFSSAQIDMDPGAGAKTFTLMGPGYDGMLARYTTAGDLDLAVQLGGADHDNLWGLATDCAGDTYVSGHFSGAVDLDPGAGVAMHTSGGGSDAFLLALDGTGAYRWSKSWPGDGGSAGENVAVDPDRMVHLQISYDGNIDGDAGPGAKMFTDKGEGDVLLEVLRPANGDW